MGRKVIACDVDGVLYQFDKTAQYMMARVSGLEFREDLPWDHTKYWRGQPEALWEWLWLPENTDPLFRHGHLYRGAIEFVRDLAALGDVVLVTKRPASARKVTLEWALYHWGDDFPFADIRVIDARTPKSVVPADVYIDDNPAILQELKTDGLRLLLTQPWNKDDPLVPEIERMTNYDDVLRRIRATF